MVLDICQTGPNTVGGHDWSVQLNKEQTAATAHLAQTLVVFPNLVPMRSTRLFFLYYFFFKGSPFVSKTASFTLLPQRRNPTLASATCSVS